MRTGVSDHRGAWISGDGPPLWPVESDWHAELAAAHAYRGHWRSRWREPDVRAEIKRMYTAPSARGTGVGRAILERLEAVAAELGYRDVLLETGLAQPEAIALYASHGWHRIEPYGHHRESPWSVCFAKALDPL